MNQLWPNARMSCFEYKLYGVRVRLNHIVGNSGRIRQIDTLIQLSFDPVPQTW